MKEKSKQVARCMHTEMINKSEITLFWIIKDSEENKCMAVTVTEGLAFQDPHYRLTWILSPRLGIQAVDDGLCSSKCLVIILALVYWD